MTRPRPLAGRAPAAVALVVYAAGSILLFRPLNPFTTSALSRAGLGDPAQMAWFLAFTPHAIARFANPFFTTLLGFPTGVNLANNTSVPLLGLAGWPVTAVLGPVATVNAFMRLGPFAAAASQFFVLRRFTPSWAGRFVGGLVFGFGPYVVGQEIANTHVNLLFVPLIPPLLVVTDEIVRRQTWRPVTAGVVLGACCAGQVLVAPELLSDTAVVGAVVVGAVAARHWRLVGAKLPYALRALGVAALVFGVVCGFYVYEMVAGPNHLRGPVYAVSHLQGFHANLAEILAPSAQQLLSFPGLTGSFTLPTRDLNELGGYLSIPFVVVLVAAVVRWWRRRYVVPLAIGIVTALVCAAGRVATIGGLHIPLPETILTHVPLLESTIPSRFALVSLLCASTLFAVAIGEARREIAARAHRVPLTIGGVCVVGVVLLFLAPAGAVTEQPLLYPTTLGATIARHVTPGAVVLTYPYPVAPEDEAMEWQAASGFGFTLLGGYATVPGPDGVGQEWPMLQHPVEPQAYLSRLELGAHSRFPDVATPADGAALCRFVHDYGVNDLVVYHRGANAVLATRYFTRIPHTVAFSSPGLSVYRIPKGSRCA